MSETEIAAAAFVIFAALVVVAAFGLGVVGKLVGSWIHMRWTEPRLRRRMIEREDEWLRERVATAAREGNWIDPAVLAIADFAAEEGALRTRVLGVIANRAVGFGLSLTRHADPLTLVELTRTGPESDAFIGLLAGMAGEQAGGARFRDKVQGHAILLNVAPAYAPFESLIILDTKVFFEPELADRPMSGAADHGEDDLEETAELFIKIDIAARLLTISEKDQGYRPTLLRRFGTTATVNG